MPIFSLLVNYNMTDTHLSSYFLIKQLEHTCLTNFLGWPLLKPHLYLFMAWVTSVCSSDTCFLIQMIFNDHVSFSVPLPGTEYPLKVTRRKDLFWLMV